MENDQPSYISPQNPTQQPTPPIPHPDSIQHNVSVVNQLSTSSELPPLPSSSPPPLPPPPPMTQYPMPQFMQAAGNVTYSYSMVQQPSMAAFPAVGASLNNVSPFTSAQMANYQGFQSSDGNYYSQPSSMPMAPISRQ